jgi:hypothetical protein
LAVRNEGDEMAGTTKVPHALVGVALAVGLLAGACSSSKPAASSTTTSGVPTTTVPVTSTSTPAVATTAPTTPPTTTVVGLVLTGVGTTLTPPSAPTAKPYSTSCNTLVDPGFYGECLTVTAPGGTIAAIVEQQKETYQQGQPIVTGQERDLVYRLVGGQYLLVLRRVPVASGESETRLYSSDIMRDGDPKAVFVTPAPNGNYANELDVVDTTGSVTLYRQLHGGFADVATGGGLQTYLPDPQGGYYETVIRYQSGAWRIVSNTTVSQSQAQAENAEPFYDPTGQSS